MRPNGRLAVGKFGSQTTGSGRLPTPINVGFPSVPREFNPGCLEA